jgi:CubicO group peptidase (beta-lactamase class C family)
MNKVLWLLFLISTAIGCKAQPSSPDKAVDSIVRSYMKNNHAVGWSIGVLKEGKTWFYGYGEIGKGSGKAPDPATIFEIGSISKTFTATLLAAAVLEGKARLDDTVNKYLPDSIPLLQFSGKVMRLRDLANHTSGLPRMPPNFFDPVVDLQDPYRNYTIEKLYAFLKHWQPAREPRSKYDYSNVGVGLLGVILQGVYGLSYEELVMSRICRPLGMYDTRVTIRKQDSVFFAKGYDFSGNYNSPWNLPAAFAGAGAIRSTVRDMLKYAQANLDGGSGELGKAIQLTHDSTFSQGDLVLGLAWHYIRPGEERVLFHNGGTGGFRSYLAIHLKQQFAVVVLANTAISPDGLGNELMKWLEKRKG